MRSFRSPSNIDSPATFEYERHQVSVNAQRDAVWRRLAYSIGDSRHHIALSNALVRLATVPTVWWHSTARPTLILGTGQRTEELVPPVSDGRDTHIVRRHTGGTAVLAAPGVLGLDVALPAAHPLSGTDIVEAYRWLGETWAAALHAFGVEAHIVSIAEARAAGQCQIPEVVRMACFGTLSPYEIAVGGRKLVGFAQVRRRSGVLLQSGIHLHFDARGIAALLPSADPESTAVDLGERAVGLDEVAVGQPNEIDIMQAFERALEDVTGTRLIDGDWTADELALAIP
jgi:lipoate-protein ligase A